MTIFMAQIKYMEAQVANIGKRSKFKSYLTFTKFRLSASVIISALSGYLCVGGRDGMELFYLLVGGLLVTAASNGSNQIWERNLDKKMKRTSKRPLPAGEMSVTEAYIVVAVSLLLGLVLLYMLNLSSALLGFAAYVSYVFMYTRSSEKQHGPYS